MKKAIHDALLPFVAPPNLRPEDLKNAATTIPRASIRCAQWEDDGALVRIGLQLGDDGPGFWLTVSRRELGYHAPGRT